METLTYFIQDIFNHDPIILGETPHQTIENSSFSDKSFANLAISGSLIKEVVFEEVIFENCTFFASQLVNCLFINCLFINCKFQFSQFTGCNFESNAWENCLWGLSTFKDSVVLSSEHTNSFAFESHGPGWIKKLGLHEFLDMSA